MSGVNGALELEIGKADIVSGNPTSSTERQTGGVTSKIARDTAGTAVYDRSFL
jgi:hypothetical protein